MSKDIKSKILVIKNDNTILISVDGKKLIINGDLFESLKDKNKDEIIEWYEKR